jgi:fructokinase
MGEALIDFLPLNEGGRTVGFRMHPGGSLLNVAVACARLGQPVALATKIAPDFFGRFLRDYAAAEGVDPRFLGHADALSTLAFVAHEGGEPVFTFYGEGAADTLLTAEELPQALFDDTAILHFGSISLLRGATPAAALAAAERLKGRALLSLDPNLRPGLVRDEAAYRATLARAIALADLVKISAADLGWLMPGIPVEDAAAQLLAQGPALVVVTRGGAGVLAARHGRPPLSLPAFSVTVADTVGAGDSFNGGMLTSLAEGGVTGRAALAAAPDGALAATLRFAAAVAAINCTRPGADPPRRPEVEAFLAAHAE